MSQTWENSNKTNAGPNFGSFGPNLDPKTFFVAFTLPDIRHCCKLSLYAISRKTNEPNLRKWQKNLVLGSILTHLAQIRVTNSFFQISGFASL